MSRWIRSSGCGGNGECEEDGSDQEHRETRSEETRSQETRRERCRAAEALGHARYPTEGLRDALAASGQRWATSHDSYLINLARLDATLRARLASGQLHRRPRERHREER